MSGFQPIATLQELYSSCPALEAVIQEDTGFPGLLQRLLDQNLTGVFSRYLQGASTEVLRTTLSQLLHVNWTMLQRHRELLTAPAQALLREEDVAPVTMTSLEDQVARRADDVGAGFSALASGWWAAVAFAGGAGTRFASGLQELEKVLPQLNEVLRRQKFDPSAPKGVFPISPVAGLTFYELILADALHAGIRCGRLPLVLFLTSSVTDERTVRALGGRELWGLPPGGWRVFQQAHEPRLDEDGQIVVADEHGHLAWTGDGHGGVYRALLTPREEGVSMLERLRREGVSHLVMHNVDNAAAHPFEPGRLGFHQREGAQFTLSVTRKTVPEEKVGLLLHLRSSGRIEVVEYNVLDPALAGLRDPATGRLRFDAANINTNLVSLDAVRADIEPTLYAGKEIPSRIGGVKSSSIEMLNQHLTRALDPARVRAYEVARERFFMPTKNISGVDSVASTADALSARHARSLKTSGAAVSPRALCDLHPACGFGSDTLAGRGIGPGWKLMEGSRLYLCARFGVGPDEPVGHGALTLEQGSSLILEGARPYGEISMDRTRLMRVDPRGASRFSVGQGVVVRAGVRVAAYVGPGSRLIIPSGREFTKDVEVAVGPGQELEI